MLVTNVLPFLYNLQYVMFWNKCTNAIEYHYYCLALYRQLYIYKCTNVYVCFVKNVKISYCCWNCVTQNTPKKTNLLIRFQVFRKSNQYLSQK